MTTTKPFTFRRGQEEWDRESSPSLLHAHITVDLSRQPELAALVQGARDALRNFPLSHVQDPWFHITLDQITDELAARIPQRERDALIDELTKTLRDVEPFNLTGGPPPPRPRDHPGRARRCSSAIPLGCPAPDDLVCGMRRTPTMLNVFCGAYDRAMLRSTLTTFTSLTSPPTARPRPSHGHPSPIPLGRVS
ncbi:hypothetical protein GCM10010336_14720 [Streptomyces goshikiensis]|nr:hypothetical protein GCM10010336_14720 [Streptomyces goshikiensis]